MALRVIIGGGCLVGAIGAALAGSISTVLGLQESIWLMTAAGAVVAALVCWPIARAKLASIEK